MASESKKHLALAIIDFLNTCTKDGTLPGQEDADSISVASQIIADTFKVNPDDKDAVADALSGQTLLSIYSVFEKMKSRPSAAAGKGPAVDSPSTPPIPTPEQRAEAESFKGQGNAAMAKKDYSTAIELYTKALGLTPENPIFLSNRAAAYSASSKHDSAVADAQAAVAIDPSYSKAWSRLGLAKFALGDTNGAMEAYKAGMDVESKGGKTPSEAMRRGYETASRRLAEEAGEAGDSTDIDSQPRSGAGGGLPDLASLAGMFGGGGGGGGGGMPDISGLLNNPMVAQMAQQVMKNPEMLSKMMNNPKLKEMMDGVSGGRLPDMSQLMSDPSISDMAKNFMGLDGKAEGDESGQ